MRTYATISDRENLARQLKEQLCRVGPDGGRRPEPAYAAGTVARAYLTARRITVEEDEDGFGLQVEVNGDILPWLHGVPDGATVRSVTEHGRTQWHAYDKSGARLGVVFHGVGSMWQWQFQEV